MNIKKTIKYIILVAIVIVLNLVNLVITPHLDSSDLSDQFEIIKLGKYSAEIPEEGNIEEEIEWLVISEDSNKKLLISKNILLPCVFNTYDIITTWEDSDLRKHLNSVFYESSFTEREREKILQTRVIVDKNELFGTGLGSATEDKIFILSNTELNKYLNDNKAAVCGAIASACGCTNYYWTRTSGYSNYDMCCIDFRGQINKYGYAATSKRTGVRPAMWIKK